MDQSQVVFRMIFISDYQPTEVAQPGKQMLYLPIGGYGRRSQKPGHLYARHLLLNGIPINFLPRSLGHSSIQTALFYLEPGAGPVGES